MRHSVRDLTIMKRKAYDSAAVAYFAAMAIQPSNAAKVLINQFILGEKADGSWAKTRMMIIAQATEQAGLLNLMNPAEGATNLGGCVYTPYFGWAGDAVAKYIDMGRGFADGGVVTLNDCHIGVNCNQQIGTTGIMYHLGTPNSGSTTYIGARADGSNEDIRVNDATALIRASSSRVGMRVGNRTGAATKEAFYNGVSTGTSTGASTSISTGNVTLLRRVSTFCADRVDFGFWGAALTSTQILNRYNRFQTLMAGLRAL